MNIIWKFPLNVGGIQIWAPKDWKPLYVGMQDGQPTLWAMVDPNASLQVNHDIICIGTGHETDLPPDFYIGTVQMSQFVWHFFWDRS